MKPGTLALCALLGAATSADAQVLRRGDPVSRPQVQVQARAIVRPDVPLLIGMNSGHAVQVQDMEGAGAERLAGGFSIGRTSTAPGVGRGAQGQLISLVPGSTPMVRVLLPEPGWQPLDGRLQQVVAFTFEPEGRVMYGVSCRHGQVFRYDTQRRELATVGTPGTGPGQLECPEKIALDRAGRIYVADRNRVVRMNDISGNGWTTFGEHGSGVGRFNYIRGLAVDSRGRIHISDFFNSRIVRIDDITGAGWAELRTGIGSPEGLAVDLYDRLYVAQPRFGEVLRVDDITGVGARSFYVARAAALSGTAGPAVIVPLRPRARRDVIR